MEDLEILRADWDASASSAPSNWLDDEDVDAEPHWHWDVVVRRTLIDLCSTKLRRDIFEWAWSSALEFGSPQWYYVVAQALKEKFPLGSTDTTLPFWVTLGAVPLDAHDKYAESGIPVFSDRDNARLRGQRTDRGKWMKFLAAYYTAYLNRVFDIYLIVDPNSPENPRYRLGRSLAISPDQRIFLANEVQSGELRVVKWSANTGLALRSWTKVRNTGIEMIEFATNYALTRAQPVILMEPLSKIDVSDDIYALLADVLPQLETLHRAGMVHSDIKLDNIMKRDQEPPKYFIIDYDTVSDRAIEGIENAVARRVYSLLWASQIRSNGTTPTSYRYDLEELFYAIGDLAKQKRRVKLGSKAKLDMFSDAETLMKAKYSYKDILPFTHQTKIVGDEYLSKLYVMIMNLPERMPFAQISHKNLRDYVMRGERGERQELLGEKCEICCGMAQTPVQLNFGIVVCSTLCAALAGSALHRTTVELRRHLDKRVDLVHECGRCGEYSQAFCKKCSLPYCSPNCQLADWTSHRKRCASN